MTIIIIKRKVKKKKKKGNEEHKLNEEEKREKRGREEERYIVEVGWLTDSIISISDPLGQHFVSESIQWAGHTPNKH